MLQQCNIVYVDGTFKTCPLPYKQFMTIHGLFREIPLPFVMALMRGKTVGQYRQLFQHVKSKVREVTGHNWRPRTIVSDFEISLITAIETEMPQVRTPGCYFLFCQSMWRRIQNVGISRGSKICKEIYGYWILASGISPSKLLIASHFKLNAAISSPPPCSFRVYHIYRTKLSECAVSSSLLECIQPE